MGRRAPWIFLAATVLAAAVLLWLRPPSSRSDDEFRIDPEQGALLGRWMDPGPSGLPAGLELESGQIRQSYGVFTYKNARSGARHVLEIHHRDALRRPGVRTGRFALVARGDPPPEALLRALVERLQARESGWRWTEAPGHPASNGLRGLLDLQIPAALFLLLQAPLWLGLAYAYAFERLRALDRRSRLALLGAAAAAAVLRWVWVPHRLVSLYVGYQLTGQAIDLEPIPRYGAGVFTFQHGLLAAFGEDHLTLLWADAVIGVALLPLLAALSTTLWPRRPGVAAVVAWLWALVPAFVVHDVSEANTAPILWWLLAGTLLLHRALHRGSGRALVGAVALGALCMTGRPEQGIFAPAVAAILILAWPSPSAGARKTLILRALPALLGAFILVLPQAVHVSERAALLSNLDSLPFSSSSSFIRVGVLDPEIYPAGLWPFAALALLLGPRRRAALAALSLAGIAFALTWVDLCPANILRVQVPGAAFFMLVVASGLHSGGLWLWRPGAGAGMRRVAGALALAGVVVSFLLPARTALTPTNEDLEEETIRLVRSALRSEQRRLGGSEIMLVRLGYPDLKGSQTGSPVHLYFPDYLFTGGVPGPVVVRSIRDWMEAPSHPRAYFYLGMRCFTPERPYGEGPPARVPMREACARILREYSGATIYERRVESRGDPVHTGYYGSAKGVDMDLKLVRLSPGL